MCFGSTSIAIIVILNHDQPSIGSTISNHPATNHSMTHIIDHPIHPINHGIKPCHVISPLSQPPTSRVANSIRHVHDELVAIDNGIQRWVKILCPGKYPKKAQLGTFVGMFVYPFLRLMAMTHTHIFGISHILVGCYPIPSVVNHEPLLTIGC